MDFTAAARAARGRISACVACGANTRCACLEAIAKNWRVSDHDSHDIAHAFAVFILATARATDQVVTIFMAHNIGETSVGATATS